MEKPSESKSKKPQKETEDLKEMSFLDHLDELRSTIIQSLLVFLLLSIGCWFFSGTILDLLVNYLRGLNVESLYFQSPIEAFMVRLKISFVLGLMVSFPFILFKVWAFVSPGLFSNERKKVYPFMITSSLLFYLGVGFCYFVLIPLVLNFLLGFGTEFLKPLLSVTQYFVFVARLSFTFGIVFQLPVIVLILTMMDLVTPGFLLRQWRYAVVIIFVAAAILTPPDVISQLMMALPVLFLYFGSVLVAYMAVRKREKED